MLPLFHSCCDTIRALLFPMETPSFPMETAVYAAPWSLPAPPRVELVSGLVRQNDFVPSRRKRRGRSKLFEAVNGGGGAPE